MDTNTFLGLEFKPFTLEDKNLLDPFLKKYAHPLSGYTFAHLFGWVSNLCTWNFIEGETLLISIWDGTSNKRHLQEPVGLFSVKAQEELLELISKNPYPIQIMEVSEQFIKKNPKFCSQFKVETIRKRANYLYRAEDLALLLGRHYEKKRNLISQAEALYEWTLEPMTKACHPYCPEILEKIGAKKDSETSNSLQNELKALDTMLNHFDVLDLKGDVIIIENKPVAFSIYGRLDAQTADVYFEKADIAFKGLYQLINRETAKNILKDGYKLINREQDLDLQGLRQAKASYFPIELLPSHTLTFITNF